MLDGDNYFGEKISRKGEELLFSIVVRETSLIRRFDQTKV
jgi:hypothetical protein